MYLFEVSTDSTSDLGRSYCDSRKIWFTPLTFTMEKQGEIHKKQDDFTNLEEYITFYREVSNGWFPRTSQLNYQAHIEHFTEIAKSGVKRLIHLTISSQLSGINDAAIKAAKDICQTFPDFKVYIVDSLSATYGQGMLVRIAADCRDKGWTVEQTYEYLMMIRHKIQHCIIPNDLFYLNKGGRMTAFAAGVGTVLNIKPLLVFDESGKLKIMERCRGMRKAFLKTIDCLNKTLVDENHNLITIVHTNNQKGAQELADMIQTRLNITPDIKIMGPVIGSHVGPGSVSCTWVSTSTREDLFKIFKSY